MTTTLNDLVYDVQSYMYGFGRERDKATYLTQDLGTSDNKFTVDEPNQVDRGIVEIDDEQIEVRGKIAGSTSDVQIMPYGRGANGTTAAVHSAGVKVTINPRWPRRQIINEINRIVQDLFPDLYNVKSATLTWQPALAAYMLPADCYTVISASYKTLGPSGSWRPITRYRYDPIAYAGQFASSRSLSILESAAPGQLVKVIYRSDFGQFSSGSDTMTSVGLQEAWRDIIALGVQARLVGTMDIDRLQLNSVESADRAQYNQPTMASQVAKSLRQDYKDRRADEAKRLLQLYPGSATRTS